MEGSVGSAVSTAAVRRMGETDKAMVQRRRRVRPGPEGPGACKGDANASPKGTYRATNVGHFSVHVT